MIFVVEFVAAVDSAGTTQTVLVGTQGFTTGATDTPASASVRARLINAGEFARSIATGKLLLGQASAGFGECVIANQDGALDAWIQWGVGDRAFTLRAALTHPGTYPAGWTTIYVATMRAIMPSPDGSSVRILLNEKIKRLEKPLCPVFDGSGGLEGPSEYEGEPKPVCYGAVYNAPLTLIDASQLIYQASARGSVVANHAKDNVSVIARALTGGDDGDAETVDPDAYEDYDALEAASVPIGHYVTIASAGVAKFGSPPVGTLTADLMELTGPDDGVAYGAGDRWTEGDTGTDNTDTACAFWSVLRRMAIDAGLDESEISTDDWDRLATDHSAAYQYGYWARDLSTTFAQAMSHIATSSGAWFGFDRLGVLRCRTIWNDTWVVTPEDPVVLTVREANCISFSVVQSDEPGRGIPFGRVVMRYPKNWMPQTDLAGAVGDKVRAQVALDFPRTTARDSTTVQAQHLNAAELSIDVYSYGWRAQTNGPLVTTKGAFHADLVELIEQKRLWAEAELPLTLDIVESVDLWSNVLVKLPRYGLDDAHIFRVVGIKYSFHGGPRVRLTLWGGEEI